MTYSGTAALLQNLSFIAPLYNMEGLMDSKTQGLSKGVAQVVKRLFTDDLFREEALEHPELAFEGYSLDDEERGALRSLVGKLGSRSLFSTWIGPESSWA